MSRASDEFFNLSQTELFFFYSCNQPWGEAPEAPLCNSPKLHIAMYSSFPTFRYNFTASFPGFSLLPRENTLVAAGHVTPKIWEPKIREGKKGKELLL